MSKHQVAVLRVVAQHLSVTAAAAGSGLSRGHLHRLLRRYRDGGLDALEPRSGRPHSSPCRTSDAVELGSSASRTELTACGLDAWPATIAWHLGREGVAVPVEVDHPAPPPRGGLRHSRARTRPRSSWIRFEAAANELWQSDFTHWRLADGAEVEVIDWLDDHPGYLLGLTTCARIAGDDVVATFVAGVSATGRPMCRRCRDS